MTFVVAGDALEHHGVKGQRWGVRKKTSNTKRTPEERRRLYKNLAATGAVILTALLLEHGPTTMSKISEKAEKNRRTADIPALASKAADLRYAKSRGGVYKITTL